MAKKINISEGVDFRDFGRELSTVITNAFEQGAKKGFSKIVNATDFIQELQEEMEDYYKSSKLNEEVRQRMIANGGSREQALLDIKREQLKLGEEGLQNDLIRQVQANKRLIAEREHFIASARAMGYESQAKAAEAERNRLIDSTVDLVKKYVREKERAAEADERALEMAKKLERANEWLETFKEGWEDIIDILKTPQLAKAVFLEQTYEKLGEVYESFEKLNQSGLSVGQRIDYMTKGFSLMSLAGLSDTKGVLDGMNETFGSLNALTSSEVDHLGHLAKAMGVTGQEAFMLVENFSKLPGETMETATHTADFVQHLAKANGVAPGKITKEIAKNTELIAVGGYRGAKAFAEAAMKAQKMGVELSTTAKVMNSLLNFEDSINKQMEASVLLGREINLDKARELALNGKSVEATQEILRNVGGQAAFEKMNVLQKQALAAAAGMTVEELQKGLDAQIETNKYSGEQTSDLKERLGLVTEVGGGIVGFFKEYGLAILAATQLMSTLKLQKLGVLALDKVSSLFSKNQLATTQAQVVAEEELAAAKKASAGGSFLGAGAAAAVGPMLAFGAAVLMVGAGIGIAALGMSKLVESFSGLGDAAGPAAMAIFSLSAAFAIMVPSLVTLATAATASYLPLLALGGAVLLIGGGIAVAAYGVSVLAEKLSLLATKDTASNLYSIGDSLLHIATGLGAIALTSAALPILSGLGDVNLKSENEGSEGLVTLKEEMEKLNATMTSVATSLSKPGVVYMDSRKVGEALRLYGYTTKAQ